MNQAKETQEKYAEERRLQPSWNGCVQKITNQDKMLDSFCIQYNPSYQDKICKNPEHCFFAEYPTLGKVRAVLGDYAPEMWLVPQLLDLSEFCGCKDKLTTRQMEQLAGIMAGEFYWLKISELMLFFYKFKAGCYGKFYGAVDPMTIMCTLREFVRDERNAAYARREDGERKRRDAEDRERYMKYLAAK